MNTTKHFGTVPLLRASVSCGRTVNKQINAATTYRSHFLPDDDFMNNAYATEYSSQTTSGWRVPQSNMTAPPHPGDLALKLVTRVSQLSVSWRVFNRWQLSVFLLGLILVLVSPVSGLSCVQCVSMNAPSCLHGDIPATPCQGPDSGSTYCLKSVGTRVSGHGHFVFRTCSKTIQTNCTLSFIEGDLYNVCHDSCIQDGCNMATSATVNALALLLPWIIIIL